ncbi:MAG TPA: hypothetical protein VIL74_20620 [Pyrinomonadaceae bacterium]|jgi:hypothetical protein
MYFYGRGEFFLGEIDADGNLLAGESFHCPEFEIEVEQERLQHENTSNAVAALDLDIVIKHMPKCRFVIDTFSESILANALSGEASVVETGNSFSAKAFPNPVVVGKTYPVPGGYSNLESFTMTDSAGTPATPTAGTHYSVDLPKGLVKFLNLGSFTQPFKAAGAEVDGYKAISIATIGTVLRFGRFAGINLADEENQTPFTATLYKMSINSNKIALKSTGSEVNSYEFNPSLLIDPNAPFAGALGQFGHLMVG